MSDGAVPMPATIRCYADPGCPWTWITVRWLLDTAPRRGVAIEWRCVSLAVVNADREVPEAVRARQQVAALAHRVMAAASQGGHPELVEAVVETAGAGAFRGAVDDERWDAVVAGCTAEAMAIAGPDVGSPVLAWGDPVVGVFGPIVSPAPTGDEADRLLEQVVLLGSMPWFYELKRGRTIRPDVGDRP